MNGFAVFLTVVFIMVFIAGGGFLYATNNQLKQDNAGLNLTITTLQQEKIGLTNALTAAQNENNELKIRQAECNLQSEALRLERDNALTDITRLGQGCNLQAGYNSSDQAAPGESGGGGLLAIPAGGKGVDGLADVQSDQHSQRSSQPGDGLVILGMCMALAVIGLMVAVCGFAYLKLNTRQPAYRCSSTRRTAANAGHHPSSYRLPAPDALTLSQDQVIQLIEYLKTH